MASGTLGGHAALRRRRLLARTPSPRAPPRRCPTCTDPFLGTGHRDPGAPAGRDADPDLEALPGARRPRPVLRVGPGERLAGRERARAAPVRRREREVRPCRPRSRSPRPSGSTRSIPSRRRPRSRARSTRAARRTRARCWSRRATTRTTARPTQTPPGDFKPVPSDSLRRQRRGPTRSTARSPQLDLADLKSRFPLRPRGTFDGREPGHARADVGGPAEHRAVRLHRQGRRHRRGPAGADRRGPPRALPPSRPGHARRLPAKARRRTASRRRRSSTSTATTATS